MSWTPDLFIVEFRPWPDSVCVTRGNRLYSRIYVPQEALTAKELIKCHVVAENAKLRELVEYMHRCYVRGHDWGPYGAPEQHWVEERMRELGIEVDDA